MYSDYPRSIRDIVRDIRGGDDEPLRVWSVNAHGRFVSAALTEPAPMGQGELVEIKLEDGTWARLTPRQTLMRPDRSMIAVSEVRAGMTLMGLSGEAANACDPAEGPDRGRAQPPFELRVASAAALPGVHPVYGVVIPITGVLQLQCGLFAGDSSPRS